MSERNIRVSPAADRDLDRLILFLSAKSDRAALAAGAILVDAIRTLAQFPESGRPARKLGWRERVVRFGSAAYIILYRIEADYVFVARIFHSREHR